MKEDRFSIKRIWTLFVFVMLFILPMSVFAEQKVVRVGWYASPQFQDGMSDDAEKGGYSYEYLQKVADYTDWQYTYVYGGWADLFAKLQKGEIDVLAGVSDTPERRSTMTFPQYHMGTDKYFLFQHKDNPSMMAFNKLSFVGKKIGSVRNNRMTTYLEKWARDNAINLNIVLYDNFEERDKAFVSHVLDGAAATGNNIGAQDGVVPVALVGEEPFYLAVNKERPDLLQELNSALDILNRTYPNLLRDLQRESYGSSFDNSTLSKEEENWLSKHQVLRVGYVKNYMPFCGEAADGKVQGILTDIMEQLVDKLHLNNRLQVQYEGYDSFKDMGQAINEGNIDVSFFVINERKILNEMQINATSEVMNVSFSAAYLGDYSKKTFDVIASYARPVKKVKDQYPDSKILQVASDKDALDAVKSGKATCTIMSSYRLNYLLNYPGYRDIKVMPLSVSCNYSLGVAKDNKALLSLMDKGIFMMDNAVVNDKLFRYIQSNVKYTLTDFIREYMALVLLLTFAVSGAIVMFLMHHNRSMARAKREVEEQLRQINALNGELEERQAQLEESASEQEAQIEEIQALNGELQETKIAAESANEAKTIFLNNMSHDIRTPMNAILGFTDILEKELDKPEKAAVTLKKIKSSGKYLLEIINNVLDMARIESGKATLNEDFNDLYSPSNDISIIFEAELRKKNLILDKSIDITHRYVMMDSLKIAQICMNLLSNAIKYTPEGGTITVNFSELPSERPGYGTYVMRVADNGIGMSEEFQETIFDAFTRERNTTQSKVIGTGLGMSVVKKLVELMHGTIEVESELGKGTTFTVAIEHKIVENPEDYIKHNQEQEAGHVDFTNKRILLAEDNELNAEIAMAVLEEEGFKVEHAEDGVVCVDMLNKAEAGYYDIILMDVQMPNLNGYAATGMIRKLHDKVKAQIPILAMTANAFDEDKKQALAAGMDGFCTKPIDVEQLNRELARVLK